MDFLKSAVVSAMSGSFPYIFREQIDNGDSIWTLHDATKRSDGTVCSVFTYNITANKYTLPLARNGFRKLRSLRHPGIIRVLDAIETETALYIITEKVAPLGYMGRYRSYSDESAKWGLHAVATTLKFINEDASSVHGEVRLASVYTSGSGEWKLGGFDILSSMKDSDAVIYTYGRDNSDRYTPPEIGKGGLDVLRRIPLHAMDSYGFGVLIFEVFNPERYRGSSQAGQTTNIPHEMQQSYKRLMHSNPKIRLSVSDFLDQGKRMDGFFDTPLIKFSEDIDNLGLKDETEREELLDQLNELSDDFPHHFFEMKVLPELIKSVEYGGGGPKVLSAILKIGSALSEDEYSSKVTPVIIRLFGNPDRVMRVCLLDNLPLMIPHLAQKAVNDKIFPQMVTGFTDSAPLVREKTVMSVLTLITKLSDRVINGELLRYLAKTANDEQPGIRTNTTICLGKIARNLGKGSRSKVLIAAFGRSLRDPFPHARNAGLLALAATIDLFNEEDCAARILPAICPSLIDKEKFVRDQAHKTLDGFLERVRKYNATQADSALPSQNGTEISTVQGPRIGTARDTSWAGWAISSFTNKLSAAEGEIQAATSQKPSPAESSSVKSPVVTAPAKPKAEESPWSIPTKVASPPPTSPFFEAETGDDEFEAWGDFDEEGDNAAANENTEDADTRFDDKPSASTAPSTTTSTASVMASFDDGGEPDFAGWLAAQSKAKTKAKNPLVRAASKSASMSRDSSARPAASRTPSGLSKPAAKPAPAKKIDTKPKEDIEDDDAWGAWD